MGVTLKAARINVGLTQVKAANCLKISKDTLSNYERGVSYPDVPIIKRMEEVYKIKYDDIIFLPNNNG
ncbi:helix-turn-helix transcriptional regulator [Aminipila luticellarii]|uniref:XRE family transcriptional regulator n=1 Tax=Aminipila luticellarii TaxID=2507160 RepID=A0A410PX47_9FIRM|nr:helix-turn-helix transcriptional regulator [Aminipila luticellarii]QAT43475.1 XRE family transcriptional regulator [Aminipila luticellarii]